MAVEGGDDESQGSPSRNSAAALNLDLKMKEAIAQYEEKIENNPLEVSSVISIYRTTSERKNEELGELEHWSMERNHFLGLIEAGEVNYMEAWYEAGCWACKLKEVKRIHERVRDVESIVNPLTTPWRQLN